MLSRISSDSRRNRGPLLFHHNEKPQQCARTTLTCHDNTRLEGSSHDNGRNIWFPLLSLGLMRDWFRMHSICVQTIKLTRSVSYRNEYSFYLEDIYGKQLTFEIRTSDIIQNLFSFVYSECTFAIPGSIGILLLTPWLSLCGSAFDATIAQVQYQSRLSLWYRHLGEDGGGLVSLLRCHCSWTLG